jgi:uncharacterized protein (DUF2235 family)
MSSPPPTATPSTAAATAGATAAPRQLVLLADGTNMNFTGGLEDSHVVLLKQWLAGHPDTGGERLVFYDPGVGHPRTLHAVTLWDRWIDHVQRASALAFGLGVQENVAECYQWLATHWREGDQIFLFGFSRGAFTVRSVAGLINRFGLVRPEHVNMVPSLVSYYYADLNWPGAEGVREQVRQSLCDAPRRDVPVQFIGVWDTVAAVGMPGLTRAFSAKPDLENKVFLHVRHALALHEYRRVFTHRPYWVDKTDLPRADFDTRLRVAGRPRRGTLRQRWFPGDHCDVGGGHTVERAQLAAQTLPWMLRGARRAGLRAPAGLRPAPTGGCAQAVPRAQSTLTRMPFWALLGLHLRDGLGQQRARNQAHRPPTMTLSTELLALALGVMLLGLVALSAWLRAVGGGMADAAAQLVWWRWQLAPPFVTPPAGLAAAVPVSAWAGAAWQFVLHLALLLMLCLPASWAFMALAPRRLCSAAWPGARRLNLLGLALPGALVAAAVLCLATWCRLAGQALAGAGPVPQAPLSIAHVHGALGTTLADAALLATWLSALCFALALAAVGALLLWAMLERPWVRGRDAASGPDPVRRRPDPD